MDWQTPDLAYRPRSQRPNPRISGGRTRTRARDRRWTWLLAFGMLAALAALPSLARAQGLRSHAVSVTLVVTKPATDGGAMRFDDVNVAVPPAAATRARVRLTETLPAGTTLWVRDADGRLTRVDGAWVEVPAETSLHFRVARAAPAAARHAPMRLAYVQGEGRERPVIVAVPLVASQPATERRAAR